PVLGRALQRAAGLRGAAGLRLPVLAAVLQPAPGLPDGAELWLAVDRPDLPGRRLCLPAGAAGSGRCGLLLPQQPWWSGLGAYPRLTRSLRAANRSICSGGVVWVSSSGGMIAGIHRDRSAHRGL